MEAAKASRIARRLAARADRVARRAPHTRGTGVLATIGATAPFVGLFGTVWGIMNSFIGISKAQTTNLAVVAPGIAEALLATAFGLAAAIPAVVIYNVFSRQIAGYRGLLGDASAECCASSAAISTAAAAHAVAGAGRQCIERGGVGHELHASTTASDDLAEVHEINVTPFIDVMLVLLIIFMVAAPLATVDVAVNLPASTAEPQPRPDKPIFLTVKRDLTLALGEPRSPATRWRRASAPSPGATRRRASSCAPKRACPTAS